MRQSYLRIITFILPLSFPYDIFWLYLKTTEYINDKSDGGLPQLILFLVYMMSLYKLVLFAVLWKASMNFKKFMRQQR